MVLHWVATRRAAPQQMPSPHPNSPDMKVLCRLPQLAPGQSPCGATEWVRAVRPTGVLPLFQSIVLASLLGLLPCWSLTSALQPSEHLLKGDSDVEGCVVNRMVCALSMPIDQPAVCVHHYPQPSQLVVSVCPACRSPRSRSDAVLLATGSHAFPVRCPVRAQLTTGHIRTLTRSDL